MGFLKMLPAVVKASVKRNLLFAFITCPVVIYVLFSTPENDGIAVNMEDNNFDADFMFQIAKQQNYPSSKAETKSERISRIDNVCQKFNVPGTVKGLYLYNNVTYCYTYKVASTYWMQVYRFLHGDVSYNVTKPSEISKFETHLVKTRKIRLRHLFSMEDHDEILSSFRFMMARDPYSRLWSVYVDKFVLLDNYFWSRYSPEMKRAYQQMNSSLIDLDTLKKPKIQCVRITFTEFLNYVAKRGEKKPENLDDHMRPIHYGCNPCFYRPHFVGKVETMTHEKTPILQKLGLENVDSIDDFKSYVKNEISMISDFEFKMWPLFRKTHRDCVSDISLEENMIRTFIINGYLPENIWEKIHGLLPLGPKHFKSKIIDAFLNSSRNSSMVRQQRERFRKEAFRSVPLSILDKLKNLFTYDFALFGYDPTPSYIFDDRDGNRKTMNGVKR